MTETPLLDACALLNSASMAASGSILTGVTGGKVAGLAGRLLAMPGSGDGVTMWVGGELTVMGVPPGTKAQLVDSYKIIIAEAIFGFECRAQFFRPPECDFPIGRMPGVNLFISYSGLTGPVLFPSRPLPASIAFPLFINSQNWKSPHHYNGIRHNNLIFAPTDFGVGSVFMQHIRENTGYPRTMPNSGRVPTMRSRI